MFGKLAKFISLKDAAKKSGYAPDYIGWLIRKGKIKGKKVHANISWQVLASDIIKYCRTTKNLGGRGRFLFKTRAQNKVLCSVEHIKKLCALKRYLSLKEAAKLSGYAPDYIGWLIRERKITGKKVYSGVTWLVSEEAIKKYQEKFENRKQKGKINQGVKLIYDIFPPEKIRKITGEITGWKHYETRSAKIFGIGWRFALATFVFLLLIGIGPVEIFQKIVGAFTEEEKTVSFYSTVCSGGWENPQNAQGQPDLVEGAGVEEFNEQNSAVLRNSVSQIFCEGFNGEIPDETKIKKVSLKFSWAFKKEIPEFFVPAPVPPEETPLPEETPTIEEEVFPEENLLEENLEEETENKNAEPIIEPESNPEPAPAPNPENGEESLPPSSSFWKKIVSFAFAQEEEQNISPEPQLSDDNPLMDSPEDSPPVKDLNKEEEPPVEEDKSSSLPVAGAREDEEIEVQPAPEEPASQEEELTPQEEEEKIIEDIASDAFLEIFYTLDGVNPEGEAAPHDGVNPEGLPSATYGASWQSLGKVSRNNWQGLTLEVPISSQQDLENLQISIQSLMVFDDQPTIYLDGLWLEVEYEELPGEELTPEEIAKLPRIGIEKEKFFKLSKKDFQANEEPEFEIDVPSLEAEYLKIKKTGFPSLTEIIPAPEPAPEPEVEPETGPEAEPTSTPEAAPPTEENQNSSPSSFLDKFYEFFGVKKVSAKTPKTKILNVIVFDNTGKEINKSPIIEEIDAKTKIRIPKPEGNFKAGKYEIRVEILVGKKVFVSNQEFTWGVLAINVNKSIYLPGEAAYLQMAVLNDAGHTLCKTNLRLEITNPRGETEILTTEQGTIHFSDTCGPNNVTDNPDYFAYLRVSESGTYQLKLTNLDNGYEITDSFEVQESVPFEVERVGATRINPFKASYKMTIKIKANQDFRGNIIEKVPSDFDISDQFSIFNFQIISNDSNSKQLIWEAKLDAGETYELSYIYQAPKISPQLYFLGPLEFSVDQNWFQKLIGPNEKIIFQEARQWQIAADVVSMFLFWSQGTAPADTNWTVDATYDTYFPEGNTVANFAGTGGYSSHNHTGAITLNNPSTGVIAGVGLATPSTYAHSHTSSVTVDDASSSEMVSYDNLPKYRSLKLIKYTPGTPTSTIANGIALFDDDPGKPADWTADTNQDTNMIRINSSVATGGSNLHYHNLTWSSLEAASGTTGASNKTADAASANAHTHTAPAAASTTEITAIPPYVKAIVAYPGSDQVIPNGTIAMFDGDPGAGWSLRSDVGGPFYRKMVSGSSTYDALPADSSATHSHNNVTSGVSGAASAQTTATSLPGVEVAGPTHTHTLTTSFSGNAASHIPPYTNFVIAEKVPVTVTVSGTTNLPDATIVLVAVNSSATGGIGVVIGGNWSLSITDPQTDDIITIWGDGIDDASETTAVTKYSGSGNIGGMVLTMNTLSIGSDQNTTLTLANLSLYSCVNDEDVMHSSMPLASYGFGVQGCINSYATEKLDILTGDGLTLEADDALTTYDIAINGTLTSGASTFTIEGSWDNNSVFTADVSTVTFNNAAAGTMTVDSGGSSFNNLTKSGDGTLQMTGSALTATSTLTVSSGTTFSIGGLNLTAGTLSNDGTFLLNGDETVSIANMDTDSGTVEYRGTGNYSSLAVGNNYYSLSISGIGSFADADNLDLNGDFIQTNGSSTAPAGTINVAGSWSVAAAANFYNASGTVIFDGDAFTLINTGGTGTGKDFNNIQFNSPTGLFIIIFSNLTATNNFTITNILTFVVTEVTITVEGTYSIADTETGKTSWSENAVLYLNSGTAYTIGSSDQTAETYEGLQIGANTDIRMWNSEATSTVDSTGSLYSQDNADVAGDLYIWGDYHVNGPSSTNTDCWSYAKDFDCAALNGSSRQVDVRIDPAAKVTVDVETALEIIGTSANRTTVSTSTAVSDGYEMLINGGIINIQYVDFDYLDGPAGLDIAASTTVADIASSTFENLVGTGGTDANITVVTSVIGTGEKTLSNNSFDPLVLGDKNVARTGSDDTGFWTFSGTNGEANDWNNTTNADEDDPGMLKWDDSASAEPPSISFDISANSLSLGNLNPFSVFSNNNTTTVSTNASSGYVLYIAEDGNLRKGSDDIDDVTDGGVTAGSEEYGLNTGYDDFVNDAAILSSVKTARQYGLPVTDQETTYTYKAAVKTTTAQGYYSHIITIVATGRF